MFKRFHDSDKWKKPWYIDLLPEEKAAWDFITSECDNVGVWIPNFKTADFLIGKKINWDSFIDKCNSNIEIMANGKWWIVDFCRFQYPELEEESGSRPLLSYIALLKKHGLWDDYLKGMDTLCIGLCKGMHRVQDKDKDKDNINIKSEKAEKHQYGEYNNILLTSAEYDRLQEELGNAYFAKLIEFYSAYKKEKNPKTKSDNLTIRRWVIEAVDKKYPGLRQGSFVQPSGALATRGDAWTTEDISREKEAIENRAEITDDDLAEMEKIKKQTLGKSRLLGAISADTS